MVPCRDRRLQCQAVVAIICAVGKRSSICLVGVLCPNDSGQNHHFFILRKLQTATINTQNNNSRVSHDSDQI